jgi:hypothetical protein
MNGTTISRFVNETRHHREQSFGLEVAPCLFIFLRLCFYFALLMASDYPNQFFNGANSGSNSRPSILCLLSGGGPIHLAGIKGGKVAIRNPHTLRWKHEGRRVRIARPPRRRDFKDLLPSRDPGEPGRQA